MREIKFRAWNESFMIYQENNFSAGDVLKRFSCVMQYTGLKDRNGAEVYEGDVVRGHLTYEESKGGQVDPLVGHISWNEYWCKWVISGCWGQDDNYDGLDNQIEDGSFYGEIIGNIYEDAEFVKYRGNNGN